MLSNNGDITSNFCLLSRSHWALNINTGMDTPYQDQTLTPYLFPFLYFHQGERVLELTCDDKYTPSEVLRPRYFDPVVIFTEHLAPAPINVGSDPA